jgi:superfamily I DNA and/or RNA helicase
MASQLAHPVTERIDRLRALLEEEAAEVRARNEELHKSKGERELEEAGVLLRGARLDNTSRALFGRVKVLLREDPARRGHLDRFEVRPGSVVNVRGTDDSGNPALGAAGIVTARRPGRLTVVFDETPSNVETRGIDLLRSDDDVTLRRLRDGLDRAARTEGSAAKLIETVLGHRAPRAVRPGAYQPLDDQLNDDQQRASTLGVFAEDLALVHGPPGTGKTRVLVDVVRQCVERGERVLCLTASNAAVDNLALGLIRAAPDLRLARAGHPARVHPALEERTLMGLTQQHELRKLARNLFDEAHELLRTARRRSDRGREAWRREREARVEAGRLFADARRLERQAVDDVLEKTRVLCGTLTGYESELPDDVRFDVLIVDEASQALTPALLLGVQRAGRVVLAGDHRQLPPTVISKGAARGGLPVTAFDELMAHEQADGFAHMLTVQHRMHEDLMAFPSDRFYESRLRAHEAVAAHTLADLDVGASDDLRPERAFEVIDTAGAGHEERSHEGTESRENPGEAELVERLVRAAIVGGLSPEHIGVVTPYAAQSALIATTLHELVEEGLEVDSVDGFQGREKELILVSAVRSNTLGEVGFVSDVRRLNVAITRARRKLVVIGDSATLSSDETWRAFFQHAMDTGVYRSCFELVES